MKLGADEEQIPTKESISEAHHRISKYVHKTPLLCSSSISQMAGTLSLHFKCENLQKIGAFKARGACNKMLSLPKGVTDVCTHSSGNHAMAVAYMAKQLGLTAHIVMPDNSPALKKRSVKGYGANLIISGNSIGEREEACLKACKEFRAQLVHPYDDYKLIEGQATCAKEVFEEMPQHFDYVVFPIGGGGLASGTLLSTKYFGGECKAVGAEPWLARDAYLSVKEKQLHPQLPPVSVADGLRVNLGKRNFGILSTMMEAGDIILVSEEDIVSATQLVFERMKLVIEPSSATVVAAVLKDSRFKGKRVCCILSGGNVDLGSFFDQLKAKL